MNLTPIRISSLSPIFGTAEQNVQLPSSRPASTSQVDLDRRVDAFSARTGELS